MGPATLRPSVLAILIGVALAPLALAQWQPPVGIPAPSFGINDVAPAFTHYVDNTHPDVTDSGRQGG